MTKVALSVLVLFLVVGPARPEGITPAVHLTHRSGLTSHHNPDIPPPLTLIVPAQTEIRVQLLSGMHTEVSHVDDPVRAQLVNPVYIDGRLALPAGTFFDGHITTVRSAGPFHRPGELALYFSQITLPDGEQAPISAGVSGLMNPRSLKVRLDSEGHLQGHRGFSWKDLLVGFASVGSLTTAKVLMASSTTLGVLAPASGVAFLSYELLWARGGEVNVPPQTRFRLRLHDPLTIHTTS